MAKKLMKGCEAIAGAAIQAGCRRRADVLSALLANTWLLTTAYGRMFLPLADTDIDEKVKHRAE